MKWLDRHLVLSQSDWGDLFESKKVTWSAYICVFIGYILCFINEGVEFLQGYLSLKSVYSLIVFLILSNLLVGIYLKNFYSIPVAIFGFNIIYILSIFYQSFTLGLAIHVVTICYSLMYFIINSLIFKLKPVFLINSLVFIAVFICAIRAVYGYDLAALDPTESRIINAVMLSAAGLLLQQLVLTVRETLVEQLGSIKLQVSALEAEIAIQNAKKEAREKAVQLNRISVVEALGASIAHEINQPIAAALTYCQAARNWSAIECQDAPETIQALSGVQSNVDRAARLIDNIRHLTTNKDREYSPTNIGELIRDQFNLMHAEFERRGIELVIVEPLSEIRAMVCVPEVALATINLLRNAMEAFDKPGQGSTVSVECRQSVSGWVEIVVIDNGMGLSSQGIEMAFGAFHTTKQSGVGIGLSICQEVAEHHSGSVSLAANASGGLTATLRLLGSPAES